MAEPTLAQQLASFAHGVARGGVPEDVAASVEQRVVDVLGLAVAARSLPTSQAAMAYAEELGGRGQAHAVGVATKLPAPAAAFVNGVLAHSLDYDDTHLPSVLHPSANIVPAALAAAEEAGATGEDLVRAVAVGLEVAVRLGMAGYDESIGNSVYFEHGQHATSICGAMGAAVAAGMLLGLDEIGLADTLGLAASMASGILEANRTGGTVKRLHCGWGAQSGVSAAHLVQRGFTGPPTVLEGRFGFFESWLHGSKVDLDAVDRGLGTEWAVPGIFFKPYPANHFTHAAVDAGMELRARGVRPDQVRRLVLGVAAAPLRTIGQPIETKRAPETGYQAQFSGPYALVAGLLGGSGLGVGLADYTDELAQHPERRALMALVDVVADPRCDEIFPYQFPAVVRAELTDGSERVVEVLTNRGGPQRPLTDDELAVKFRENVAGHLAPDAIETVEAGLRDLRGLGSIDLLMSHLAGAPTGSRPTH
ncbi:MmgE/PrpD family protein [Nocardioides deserti]|uniref:MmgE/PrpD family protein n=1 Tax=Nocardioides deserti TaxID=1588644 RepID=A0ABR6UBC8_9ACTN|nr:MmgE/PrpD family protein [Nocardioides deserti]MBC2961722.1 MmgE/PrpD family protein [Nocardioides deserti]GGO73064.1 MmgE/Prp family protein [Nocardioides deserti]